MKTRKLIIFIGAMLATAVAASAQITTANAAEIATSRAVKAIAQGPAVDLTPGKQQRDGTKTATSALGEVTLPKSSKDAIRAESADGSVIDLRARAD